MAFDPIKEKADRREALHAAAKRSRGAKLGGKVRKQSGYQQIALAPSERAADLRAAEKGSVCE